MDATEMAERIKALELENHHLRKRLAANVCQECSKKLPVPSPAARPPTKSPREGAQAKTGSNKSPRLSIGSNRPPMPSQAPVANPSLSASSPAIPPPSLSAPPPLRRQDTPAAGSARRLSMDGPQPRVLRRSGVGAPPSLPALPLSSVSGPKSARERSPSAGGWGDISDDSETGEKPKSARAYKPPSARSSWRENAVASSQIGQPSLSPRLSPRPVENWAEPEAYALPEDGSFVSATLMRVKDEDGVKEALQFPNRVALSVSSVHTDVHKIVWYIVTVAITAPDGQVKSSWHLPRPYSAFQTLTKALAPTVSVDLPRVKSITDGERVLVMNAFLRDLCNLRPELAHQNLALLRFADPYDSPGTFGLRMLHPIHDGWMDLIRNGKPTRYFFILKEHLYYFKGPTEEAAAGMISLDYVTIDLISDPSLPRFSFSISNLKKEVFVCSLENTKAMTEWIIKIRKAKFHRTGHTYGLVPPMSSSLSSSSSSSLSASVKSLSPRHLARRERTDSVSVYAETDALPEGCEVDVGLDSIPLSSLKTASDSPENIVFVAGSPDVIKEASVSKLVERLLDPTLTAPPFVHLFLATFRYWLKPNELFSYVVGAWVESNPDADLSSLEHIRILLIVKLWMDYHFYDFSEDEQLQKRLLSFLHRHVRPRATFSKYSEVLVATLKNQSNGDGPANAISVASMPNTILPAVFSKDHIEFIDLNPLEIARQMTLVTFGLFTSIEAKELMSQRWNSADKDTVCPNVMRMIRRFNQASLWVQTVVLAMDSVEARVNIIRCLLDVCKHLLELNNFSTVFEICSGLQGSAVKRLSETWDALPEDAKAFWGQLKDLLDSSSNFKRYRTALAECTGPSIPHLGLCLTDLTFGEDGGKTFVEGGRVNFGKSTIIGTVLVDILRRQRVPYALKPVDYILEYFSQLQPLDEKTLYEKSVVLQPKKKS